jgi:hypothetical protein
MVISGIKSAWQYGGTVLVESANANEAPSGNDRAVKPETILALLRRIVGPS